MNDLTPMKTCSAVPQEDAALRRFLLADLRIRVLTRKQEITDIETIDVALRHNFLSVADAVRILDDQGLLDEAR